MRQRKKEYAAESILKNLGFIQKISLIGIGIFSVFSAALFLLLFLYSNLSAAGVSIFEGLITFQVYGWYFQAAFCIVMLILQVNQLLNAKAAADIDKAKLKSLRIKEAAYLILCIINFALIFEIFEQSF